MLVHERIITRDFCVLLKTEKNNLLNENDQSRHIKSTLYIPYHTHKK